jgi:hypothetical protein
LHYLFVQEPQHQSSTERQFIPIDSLQKTDILFLVDNSGSMAEEQKKLADNFQAFMDSILKGQNDFHMAIVTTDVKYNPLRECTTECVGSQQKCTLAQYTPNTIPAPVQKGKSYCLNECETDNDCPVYCSYYSTGESRCTNQLMAVCGKILGFDDNKKYCYPTNNGRFTACKGDACKKLPGEVHERVLTEKLRKEIGNDEFNRMFQDNVQVGTGGSSVEKGLSAIRYALDPGWRDPLTGKNLIDNENKGFLRPDAKLTIIVVSDEEDCSYDPKDTDTRLAVEGDPQLCYPNPNSCWVNCMPTAKSIKGSCISGTEEVVADADSELVRKGEIYCMYKCPPQTTPDCISALGDQKASCQSVLGFNSPPDYCGCNYNQEWPDNNPGSKYDNLQSTEIFIAFLGSLKPNDPTGVSLATIVGAEQDPTKVGKEPPANCGSQDGVACAGKRYSEVAAGLGKYLSDSICSKDFEKTMVSISQFLIVSNQYPLANTPSNPTCIQVKVGGTVIPHCEKITNCPSDVVDGGTGINCPEALVMCDDGDACVDTKNPSKPLCTCEDFSDTSKQCKCDKSGVECKRPMYWQYIPPEKNPPVKVKECAMGGAYGMVAFQGCGMQAGDKLEISFLRSSGTTGGGLTCGN